MKILLLGAELFRVDRRMDWQTDRHIDMTKIRTPF